MKQGLICAVVALLSVISAGQSQAVNAPVNRSLTGLTAVRIIVEDLNRDTQATGLCKEQLYALAVQQLGKDSFAVIGPQDPTKAPIVYIRLSSVVGGANNDAPVSFYLTVQVKRLAMLAQGTSSTCQATAASDPPPLLATTWEKGSMAMVNRNELFFYIQHILMNLLGYLATDQKQANGLTQAE